MGVKLYSYFRSSASFRARIALHLKQIPFEYIPVHLLKNGGEQLRPEYKKLNPMAQVPALVHDGKLISQSMAIIQYVDSVWPTPPLFPNDVYDRAKVIEFCEAINSGIQPLHNLSVLNHLVGEYKLPEESKARWSLHWIQSGLSKIELMLEGQSGKFCCGNNLSAADIFLVPQIFGGLRYNLDLSPYPTVQKIFNTCMEMEAFQKAAPEAQPDAAS